MQIKIAFLAPSGYGKDTAVEILKKHYPVVNIKIASPLYKLQKEFYGFIGKKIDDTQDGELLQFFGKKIRKESPHFLLEEFQKKINWNEEEFLITNDDCRPGDYEYLKKQGFIFVKIEGYRRERGDHTPINSKSSLEWGENEFEYEYILENLSDLEEYETNILKLIRRIKVKPAQGGSALGREVKNDRESICHPDSATV